jgi:signal peptide peptidase SppA
MSKSYSHIIGAVASEVWAIQPEKLMAIVGFLQLKAQGLEPEIDVVSKIKAASIEAADRSQNVSASSGGAVAVLPLFGLIMQRGNMMGDVSGPRGTSVDQFTQSFRQALNDPSVSAIVIDVDSPGGAVSGVPELASEILSARKTSGKKIIAVSDCQCASAAYWIASACSEIVVSPSSLTGSIGVYMVHKDISKQLEQQGVSTTLISYGANKTQGNNLGPLDDDARAELQNLVDTMGASFDKAVAQGRRMKVSEVAAKLGQGKLFNAQKAVSSGMADSIGTLDGVLARFGVSRTPSASLQARGGTVQPQAEAIMPGIHAASDEGCQCGCQPCTDGDCGGCLTDDCDFAGCDCSSASYKRTGHAKALLSAETAFARRERELQLAQTF